MIDTEKNHDELTPKWIMRLTNIESFKWIYIRTYNRFGDKQGILFDRERMYQDVCSESLSFVHNDGCNQLIKQICDLRGIRIKGLPISMEDVDIALEEVSNSLSISKNGESVSSHPKHFEKLPNGILKHKEKQRYYFGGFACSVILEKNDAAKRPNKKGFRNGVTAAKSVIRSMTSISQWKMATIDSESEIYGDMAAVYEAAQDFFVENRHHLVKGMIPNEVFKAAKTMDFHFTVA